MIVKDSMVLIHLAKLTLLEKSCGYFREISIPELVFKEVQAEKFPDSRIILNLVDKKKIAVKKVRNKKLVEKAVQFNIQSGEAQCVALYWQEKAKYLATDDDNVRKKGPVLEIKVIGTPSIILKLYKERAIDRKKLKESISKLRKIGWFSSSVLDKILMEDKL